MVKPGAHYNAADEFVDCHIRDGRGARPAFIDRSRILSYADFHDAVTRVGPALAALGVEREMRIALIMHDCVEFPILFWGAIRAGIVPVLLNTRLTPEQYRYVLGDCRARVAFVSQPLLDTINAAAATVPFLTHLVPAPPGAEGWKQLESLLFAHAPAAVADTCADEVAYWQYSSGSTGQPKGVMHVESTPHFVAELCVRGRLGITESDVLFSTAKAFFAFGLNNSLVSGLAVGAAAILAEDHPTPANIASVVRSHRPTVMFAVPTTYAAMLADPSFPPDGGLERLRLCISAGEPLPPAIGRAWRDRFGVDIVNVVGSTEVGHFMLSHRPGAVDYEHSGIAVDGFDLQLTDDTGTPVATGEIGELHVRGPTIALGYWNNQERTRNTFIGEWLRTGDKYRRNADGSFVYVGRADDLFKVSGNWLSPAEVEAALMLHPNVVEAAVVPYVNADGLVKPKAFVVLRDAKPEGWGRALREELQVHVKHTIGVWKYPRWIEFIERLPRTATGKLQRYKLRGSSGTV